MIDSFYIMARENGEGDRDIPLLIDGDPDAGRGLKTVECAERQGILVVAVVKAEKSGAAEHAP